MICAQDATATAGVRERLLEPGDNIFLGYRNLSFMDRYKVLIDEIFPAPEAGAEGTATGTSVQQYLEWHKDVTIPQQYSTTGAIPSTNTLGAVVFVHEAYAKDYTFTLSTRVRFYD